MPSYSKDGRNATLGKLNCSLALLQRQRQSKIFHEMLEETLEVREDPRKILCLTGMPADLAGDEVVAQNDTSPQVTGVRATVPLTVGSLAIKA